jgi:hypothetical protein
MVGELHNELGEVVEKNHRGGDWENGIPGIADTNIREMEKTTTEIVVIKEKPDAAAEATTHVVRIAVHSDSRGCGRSRREGLVM